MEAMHALCEKSFDLNRTLLFFFKKFLMFQFVVILAHHSTNNHPSLLRATGSKRKSKIMQNIGENGE